MTRTRLSGTLAPWSIAALALLLVAGATVESHAQSQFNPYYGKNLSPRWHYSWSPVPPWNSTRNRSPIRTTARTG